MIKSLQVLALEPQAESWGNGGDEQDSARISVSTSLFVSPVFEFAK